MGSKPKTGVQSARQYAHEAAIGVNRKRKKALLNRPTTPVRVETGTKISGLLDAYRGASFQARALGNCAQIFEAMLRDRQRPTIFLGLAGSLIAAGMRQVIVDLIERRMVDVIVSTGAIISQDFYQVRGGRHYHGTPQADDKELRDLYIDGSMTPSSTKKNTGTPISPCRPSRIIWLRRVFPRGPFFASSPKRQKATAVDPGRLRPKRRASLRPRPERLIDRNRSDRALPSPTPGGQGAAHDQLHPRQLRVDANRRAEPGDRRALRVGRRAQELHQ